MQAPVSNSKFTFGLYEMDVHTGELWKAGFRVKLQSQPFKVLAALLERPGQIVTREELQFRLWGKDTVVDFDHSLGTAINKIREALGDSADNPRFVETMARRGYRFIAPVHEVHDHHAPLSGPIPASDEQIIAPPPFPAAATLHVSGDVLEHVGSATRTIPTQFPTRPPFGPPQAAAHNVAPFRTRWRVPGIVLATLLIALGVGLGFLLGRRTHTAFRPPHIVQVTHNDHLAPTIPTMEDLHASATDGGHLFASTIDAGQQKLVSIDLPFGSVEPLKMSEEVAAPALGDISPDGTRLLLRSHLSPESEQPLWVVPTLGGSAQRVGDVLAHDATWMPDGTHILYAAGDALYVTPLSGGRAELYAHLTGRAFWLRWQPNGGQLLRFTQLDPITHTTSLWQLSATNREPKQMLTASPEAGTPCCGVWTSDGQRFIFQGSRPDSSDLWQLGSNSTDKPVRLTDGPLHFEAPVASRTGNSVYFVGLDARSRLMRVSGGKLEPDNSFLSGAVRADFSHDAHSVAWTDANGALWRARADGSDLLRLTPETMDVFLASWSPDDSHLAVMARELGHAWRLYIVSAQGGEIHPLLQENRNAADPSWSPDGHSILFGRVNDRMGKEEAQRSLEIINLKDSTVTEVPGSAGLFSPRWSPNGRFIAALTLDQRRVRLFDVATKVWTTLPVASGADPVWAADSRSLVVHASMDARQPIVRINIPDMRIEQIAQLAASDGADPVDFVFVGLAADGSPLVRLRTYTGNIYSMDLP